MTTVLAGLVAGLAFLAPGFVLAFLNLSYTFGSAGALPGAVLSAVTIGALLFWLWKLHRHLPLLNWMDITVAAFFLQRIGSVLYSPRTSEGLLLAVLVSTAYLVALYVYGRLVGGSDKTDNLARDWSLGLLTLVPVYLLAPRQLTGEGARVYVENSSAVGASVPIGMWCTISICTMVLIIARRRRALPDGKAIGQILVVTASAGVLLGIPMLLANGTRGALIGAIAAAIMLILVLRTGRSFWLWIIGSWLAIYPLVAVAQYLGLVDLLLNAETSRFQSTMLDLLGLFGADTQGKMLDTSSEVRVYVQSRVISLIWDYPLFGCGYGCSGYNVGIYPHNLFLEIALEQGFLGVMLISGALFFTFRSIIAEFLDPKNVSAVLMGCCFIALFVQYQFSFAFDNSFLLMFLMGFANARRKAMLPVSAQVRPDHSISEQDGISRGRRRAFQLP